MDYIVAYFSELMFLVNEMAPWLLLGLIFAGLLKVYFPQKHIDKYLGKPNLKSAINGSLLGVPMPLCSCGVIPTGISFYKNGASKGATNSFLISTPQTGVDSIFATYSMLGWPFAILRPIVAFTTGIIGGVLTNVLVKEKIKPAPVVASRFSGIKLDIKKNSSATTEATCDSADCGCKPESKKESHSLVRAANYAFIELLQDISKWLILGFLIAALISVILPADFFSMFKGYGFIEILIVLAASIPIYVCATGSIPIAAVLLMKGVSPGAALVFLMAGPATNVATMTVIGKTMGRKSLMVYMASIIGGAIFFGLLTNLIFPADFILGKMVHMHDGEHEMLPKWVGILSTVILTVSLVAGYFIERIQKNKKMKTETFQTIGVEGMTCSHCEASVTRNLVKLDGIEEVIADKNTAMVKLRGTKLNFSEIERIITDLGYQYTGLKP